MTVFLVLLDQPRKYFFKFKVLNSALAELIVNDYKK